MKVVAEVGEWRNCLHLHLLDAAVRFQRKVNEGIGEQTAITPARDEGVELPMFEITNQSRGTTEAGILS